MIKYILTHPIQYQSPLIRNLSKLFKIHVLYRSDISVKKYFDKGFNKKVLIDRNLLKGYNYSFLKKIGPNKINNFYPFTIEYINKIFTRDTKIVWLHGIKNWYNLIIIILCKIYKKKVFIRDETNNLKKRSFVNLLINNIFYKFIDNFVDAYLVIGKENRNTYISNGISKKKLFLVPYVVDNDSFKLKKKKKKSRKMIFIFSGKLIYRKGFDLLLNAIIICNRFKNFKLNSRFIVIGDGENFNEYLRFKKENKLTNLEFVGYKTQSFIKRYYKKSKILILPSREEKWGLVINEAMSAGNMIIASDKVGACKDLVLNNFNGYTFKNNNYHDLAKKIIKTYKKKNKIDIYCKNSIKLISMWSFKECCDGLKKAIDSVV